MWQKCSIWGFENGHYHAGNYNLRFFPTNILWENWWNEDHHRIDPGLLVLNLFFTIQSEDDDCQYTDWYHMKCFFKVRLPKTAAAFDGFANLRYADQQLLKLQLGECSYRPYLIRSHSNSLCNFWMNQISLSCTGFKKSCSRENRRVKYCSSLLIYNCEQNTWILRLIQK